MIIWGAIQLIHNTLWGLYFPEYVNFLVYFPLFHLGSFILGAAGGIWFLREGCEQEIYPRVNLLFLAGGTLLASVYVIANELVAWIPRGDQLFTGLLAPFLTLVIIALALNKTRFSVFLKRPILIMLGEISYALYILHIPVKWIYERALENSNQQSIFDYTYLPLMIAIAFVAYFYVDTPLRNGLKKVMQRVSMPLLLLDLAILSASIYFSFRLRFGSGREYDSYYPTILLMFWSSFLLRTIFSTAFNGLNPSILHGSFMQVVRPILISVTVGSISIAGITYMGYSLRWFENYPRSILIMDWAIVLSLSLCVRFLFRLAGFYSPKPLAA